jgi:4-amino-4-deoxy-L-arabinose transferase-like glycosyltransferase
MSIAYKSPEAQPSGKLPSFSGIQERLAAQPTRLWHRLSLGAIVLLSAFFTFFQISINGYGNDYYAASVKSMLTSWHNFFFVSFDPGGFVSVDKPPLGLWLQAISVKLFGFSGFSLFLPQAIAALACILIIYHLVRRSFGPVAGLIAALVLALTPISVVMSRDNNQDMILVLFLVLAAWWAILATERGSLGWLLLCAVGVGLAFNVKALEAYLAVPAFGLLYLLGAPISWRKRIGHLALAAGLMLVLSLSWLVAVDLTPVSQRPYVGSSQDNSEVSLALGYNGLQRLIGGIGGGFGGNHTRAAQSTATSSATHSSTTGSGTQSSSTSSTSSASQQGQGGGASPFSNGAAGPQRLFDSDLGGQSGWFIPLALVGMIALAWQTRLRLPLSRAHQALVLWGTWLLTMGVFFSVASFFHPYYLVIIAPAIAALSGIGLVLLWNAYSERTVRDWRTWMLPVGLLLTAAGQVYILSSYQNWSFLTPIILVLCLVAVLALAAAKFLPRLNTSSVPLAKIAVSLSLVALLATPLIWSAISDMSPTVGSMPSAGPSVTNAQFARFTQGAQKGANGQGFPGGQSATGGSQGSGGTQSAPPTGSFPGGQSGQRRSGGFGGFGGGESVNSKLVSYLEANQDSTKYLFATPSSMTAAPYIIQTGKAVMAMGGFSGSDPILTQQSLAQLVKDNTVRFFLIQGGSSGGSGGPGGIGQSSLTSWVQNNCTVVSSSLWQNSTAGTSNTGFGGSNQLYDCAAK